MSTTLIAIIAAVVVIGWGYSLYASLIQKRNKDYGALVLPVIVYVISVPSEDAIVIIVSADELIIHIPCKIIFCPMPGKMPEKMTDGGLPVTGLGFCSRIVLLQQHLYHQVPFI